jgi:gamma-D-glutamyl-L-lysine dipeptidyl-peptidase
MGRDLIAADSVPVLERPEDDAPLVTELIAGERLVVMERRGGWLRVVVPGHATGFDPRGYPGWARPGGLVEAPGWDPDLAVVAPNGAGLPLGALLRREGEGVRLPDGGAAALEPGAVKPAGVPVQASPVGISRGLLGLPYRWGGTDSTLGMDCSGLVFRVMGLLGVTVPRDADDQFERAPFRSRERWERAKRNDLIFFGDVAVTHVGFYLGDGTYISEHGSSGTVVRGVDRDPYWGFARYS